MVCLLVFFCLQTVFDGGLVTLKARVLAQGRLARIRNLLLVGDLFVMGFSNIGWAQIPHPFGARVDDQNVLVGVGLLFAAVM